MAAFQIEVNDRLPRPKQGLRITAFKIDKKTGEQSLTEFYAETAICSGGNMQGAPGSVITTNPSEHLTISDSPAHSQRVHVQGVHTNRDEWVTCQNGMVVHSVKASQP